MKSPFRAALLCWLVVSLAPTAEAQNAEPPRPLRVTKHGTLGPVYELREAIQPGGFAWHPDGKTIAGANYTTVKLWEPRSGEVHSAFGSLHTKIGLVAFDSTGESLASAGDGELTFWDVKTKHARWTVEVAGLPAIAADGKLFAVWRRGVGVEFWNEPTRTKIGEWNCGLRDELLQLNESIGEMTFSPDGRLFTYSTPTQTSLYRLADKKTTAALKRSGAAGSQAAFSPDGSRIAFGSGKTLQIWDTSSESPAAPEAAFELPRANREDGPQATALSWSADGRWIVVATTAATAIIFDAASGVRLATVHAETPSRQIGFSPDGRWLAATRPAGNLVIWTVE